MTSTLERPAPRGATKGPSSGGIVATLPVAAATAAAWAALVGLVLVGVVVVLVWAVSGRGDDGIATPLQAAGVVWLVAHHAPVETGTATVTLLPMALLALPLALLFRSGRWAARTCATRTWGDAALLVAAGTAVYGLIGLLVAQSASLGGATVPDLPALGWTALVAACGLAAGVGAGASLVEPGWQSLPERVRWMCVVAATAAAACVALAGVATAVAIVARWSTVTGLHHQLAPTATDSLDVVLLSLAYLPDLLVWALAYVAGPGFAVGGGAVVDPFSMSGSLLPALPVLGAVPTEAAAAAPLLLLLPVLVGAGSVLVLRRRVSLPVVEEALVVLGGAALLALPVAVVCALAGGSLGSGRLAQVGPNPLAVAGALAALVGAGALLTVLLAHLLPTMWAHDDHVVDVRDS